VLPQAPVIYAADNAGLPYGTKTERRSPRGCGLLGRMTERFSRALSASPATPPHHRAGHGARCAGDAGGRHRARDQARRRADADRHVIGLLGTEATIRQAYVDRLEANSRRASACCAMPRPELVAAAEAKLRGGAGRSGGDRRAARPAAPAGRRRIDTVVLACTHFPLVLAEAFGPGVASSTARQGIARRAFLPKPRACWGSTPTSASASCRSTPRCAKPAWCF
jgi:glutamate racemase